MTNRAVTCLTMLAVFFSILWMALPGTASAEGTPATSLEVKLNNTTAATYSISDLQNMTQVTQGYSSFDSMPAPCMTAAQGVRVSNILTEAGIDVNSVQYLTFKSTDGYAATLTKQYLLDTPRYYYPNLTQYWDTVNHCVYGDALAGGVQVDPILALVTYYKRYDPAPEFELMDNAYALRLCFGQDPDDIMAVTSNKFAKYINEINVDGNMLPASPPVLTADTIDNTVGQPVTLSFTDNATWRAAITGITVDDTPLNSSQYSIVAGQITLEASVFIAAGDYAVVVMATGYQDTTVTQTIGVTQITVTLNLSKTTAAVGESVTASGTVTPNDWVPIKVIDSAQSIVVFDATKADANGNYSIDFIIPDGVNGALTVVAGSGSNVVNKTLTVTTSSENIKGDVNNDNTVNVLDVVQTVNFILGKTIPGALQSSAADCNSDGKIDVLDVVRMVNMIVGKS